MADSLHLLVCSTYRMEFESIIQAKAWHNVSLHPFAQACSHPQLQKQAGEQIRRAGQEFAGQAALVCACSAFPGPSNPQVPALPVRRLDQCFYMLASRSLVDHLTEQGAYILTPGWLDNWRAHLALWGFDQPTSRNFFQECTRKLVLLDTAVNPNSAVHLQEMGEYLGLPVEILPIGIDFLELYLSQIVTSWQYESSLQQTRAAIAEVNRKSADYAMTFDLLTNLTQIKNEAEAVETILDLFTMLFSPGSISYCPVLNNEFGPGTDCHQDPEAQKLVRNWAVEKSEDYRWTSSGTGFFLRFRYQSETLGVLQVDQIKMPQYIKQYLNLALSIAHLCGLSISNARTFQRLQEAESTARWEKEISETLRQILTELTLQLDLDELLDHILISLGRVTPYSDAAVSLLNGDQLIFMAGRRFTPEGKPAPFPPPDSPLSLASIPLADQDALINLLSGSSMIQQYLGGVKLLSWINVPLKLRGVLVGFLSMGNRTALTYNDSEITLAQSFADEVSIAIENARLFKEIQTLAITDGLTGLFNRRHFYHLANLEFTRSNRYNRPLSMVMLDVDLFKEINDRCGHLAGDQVLKKIAQLCSQKIRTGDIAGRYGGEEFILLLPETNEASALALSERIRLLIAGTAMLPEQGPLNITVSFGVAAKDASVKTLEELIRRSDEALYTAKRSGRNCVKAWKNE